MYIVDHAQTQHFRHLKFLLELYGRGEIVPKINHIQFGRLIGFSTRFVLINLFLLQFTFRKGIVETVEQVLEDGAEEAKAYIRKSKTIKISEDEIPAVSQELADAALIMNDLKRHRKGEYTFIFNKAFKSTQNPFYLHVKFKSYIEIIKSCLGKIRTFMFTYRQESRTGTRIGRTIAIRHVKFEFGNRC